MIINSQKIQQKINELNSQGGSWATFNGTYALTQVDVTKDSPTFFPASGVPVIIFVNNTTGELKLFPVIIFQ